MTMKEEKPKDHEHEKTADAHSEEGAQIEELQQELGEAREKYIRLVAEFDNMRKRTQREREALIRYAHEEVIIEFLGFFEDFERTLNAAKGNASEGAALVKGVQMVMKRMQDLFKKYDVREIDALGKKFDHNQHEALMVVDSGEHEDETVIEVFQKGYMLGERIVRPAKVKVARRPNTSDGDSDPSSEENKQEK